MSSQILDKFICVRFHQNRPNGANMNGCHRQTHTHIDAQTGLIPGVHIFSYEMTEYNKNRQCYRNESTHLVDVYYRDLLDFLSIMFTYCPKISSAYHNKGWIYSRKRGSKTFLTTRYVTK